MKSGGEILLAQFQQMAHGSARSFCFGGLIEVKKVYAFNTLGDLNSNTPLAVVEIQQNYECEMHSVACMAAAAGEGGAGTVVALLAEGRRHGGPMVALLAQERTEPLTGSTPSYR